MDLRLVIGSLLFAGLSTAQVPAPAGKPATAQESKPQDPDRPQPTPAQQVEELAKEKARLQQEIAYARDRAKNAKALLREKFQPRTATHRAIDAGVMMEPVKATAPAVAQPRAARAMTDDEVGGQPEGTLLVVNSRPIGQAAYDQLMTYLGSVPNTGDEAMRAQRALFELIRNEAVAAMFEDNEAAERASELMSQLDAGKSIADLIKNYAAVAGGQPDGSIEVTRNSVFGLLLELNAFGTAPGTRSRPFRTVQGIVIVQTDKIEKGATADLDKAVGKAILVPYSADEEVLNKAQLAVTTGQIEVKTRDQKTLDALPAIFRQATPVGMTPVRLDGDAAANPDVDQMQLVLKGLAEELAKPFDANDPAAKERRTKIEQQYAEVKKALAAATGREVPKVEDGAKKQD
jgi:hypothetical protein